MSEIETYNGWSNYETWSVFTWLTNDQDSDRYYRAMAMEIVETLDEIREDWSDTFTDREIAKYALADWLRDDFKLGMPEIAGMWSDLLQSSYNAVNWSEIADSLLAD
jgi:hypothetical protein